MPRVLILWVPGNGCAVWGLQLVGTPFVCAQAGELHLWSSKDVQSNTEYDRDWDLQDPHHPRAHPGVPATPSLPGFGYQEEFAWA